MAKKFQSLFSIDSFPRDLRLLVAVSGGVDSMSLLHFLAMQRKLLRCSLVACYVDHGLRKTTARDKKVVSALCATLNVPLIIERLRPPRRFPGGVELWAREQRYAALHQVRTRENAQFIVTAHHANDAAETLLMRLLANKDLRNIEQQHEWVLRPLLAVTKDVIEAYRSKYQISVSEDETNQDQTLTRNKIRLSVIPFLEKAFPQQNVLHILAHRAEVAHADALALDGLLRELFPKLDCGKQLRRALLTMREMFPGPLAEHLGARLVELALLPTLRFRLGVVRAKRVVAFFLGSAKQLAVAQGVVLIKRAGALHVQQKKR